jgi:hypothetical protein
LLFGWPTRSIGTGVQEDAREPELHEGARGSPQLRARRHHRVQGSSHPSRALNFSSKRCSVWSLEVLSLSVGYRRHVAQGAFAPGEGFDSWQHQPGMAPDLELLSWTKAMLVWNTTYCSTTTRQLLGFAHLHL